jgi:hypothetical protein
MIAVSSFRPFADCPPAIWDNQVAANRSWVRLFPQIFYFNQAEPRMRSARTAFLPTTGKPSIKNLANFCGLLNDWSCIVNADIVIPQAFRRVEDHLRSHTAACCISKRYTLPPDGDTAGATLDPTDHGLDFFAATPKVWQTAAAKIDPAYTLGRIVWDNWMVNFFMAEFGNFCYDLTPARVIFHPKHEDRTDQNWDFPKDDPILKRNNWPFHSVEL